MIWTNLEFLLSQEAFISGPVVLEKKILKDFPYIFTCKTMIPYCGPTVPHGSWFEQTWISTISGAFQNIAFNFFGPVVLEKIFKDFPYIFTCKTLIPYCGPIIPPWFEQTWISTISGAFHYTCQLSGSVVLYINDTHLF